MRGFLHREKCIRIAKGSKSSSSWKPKRSLRERGEAQFPQQRDEHLRAPARVGRVARSKMGGHHKVMCVLHVAVMDLGDRKSGGRDLAISLDLAKGTLRIRLESRNLFSKRRPRRVAFRASIVEEQLAILSGYVRD
jgi:hypothetical protein